MRRKKNLRELLNLGYLDYTNKTPKLGSLDMPHITCQSVPAIDYLAEYSRPSEYFKTTNTAVSFFQYDRIFNGLYGLWNGIAYQVAEIQDFYLERFKDVHTFIAPDLSCCGDVPDIENRHRQFASRVISLWLTMNLNCIVVPLIQCCGNKSMDYMLDGLEECNVVAFNTKGSIRNPIQRKILISAVELTVERLNSLESLVVYSATPNNAKVLDCFTPAIERGIDVQIPDNRLQIRNRLLNTQKDGE